MEPLISVIVPVYNVEPYLRKCVDSILNQTYRNLEVILVDDGSPDGCPAICDEYAVIDRRVKVVHKENEGQAIARNTALGIASGEYIAFVDSDDWIDTQLYEKVVLQLPFEIALFGCTYVYPETGLKRVNSPCEAPSVLTWASDGEKAEKLVNSSLLGYACNKMYSRIILQGLSFSNVKLREDLLFNIAVFARSKQIKLIDHAGYFYVQHQESQLHKTYSGSIPDIVSVAERMTIIHPQLDNNQNQRIANHLIKVYLCDALSKFVFLNRSVTKEAAMCRLRELCRSATLANTLRVYSDDSRLFWLLTVCIQRNLPKFFYQIMKRIWHG